jgi:large subunit ribosomal protein L6
MSRIGKLPIEVPDKVKVALSSGKVLVEGPRGKLQVNVDPRMSVSMKDAAIIVTRPDDERVSKSLHGLTRTLIFNAIRGVSVGYEEVLEISGVGFRAELKGKVLNLSLGFSHAVDFQMPEGVTCDVDKGTRVTLKGSDKHLVGMTASRIRQVRRTEPYKGKGVKYAGERIRRKVGKQGAS